MNSNKRYINWFFAVVAVVIGFSISACEDEPDKYEVAGGLPTVQYVRLPSPEVADSLLTGAYMANTVCLVGDNLRSICELFFNDQKAVLNTSYITDHTLIVDVPKNIPATVTDKIYMVTQSKDTVDFDFKVLVPNPVVNTMSCEYAKPGTEVTIYGDYMINDPNVPLTITMAGNVEVKEITNISKTAVSFILPDDAPEGYINVKSIYGVGRSKFQYKDKRNILFDWDGSRGGMAIGHGWRNGVVQSSNPEGIDGSYLYFGGIAMAGGAGATWAEDQFSFNYWPDPANGYKELSSLPEFSEMLEKYGVANLQMKFEIYVPKSNPWKSSALQAIFTSNANVTSATGNNGYFSDAALPRGLWMPWKDSGSYDTNDRWVTVTMKLADFDKTYDGKKCDNSLNKEFFTGLSFFIWNGGVEGTDCNPVICIDNIRVVPVE